MLAVDELPPGKGPLARENGPLPAPVGELPLPQEEAARESVEVPARYSEAAMEQRG
ncbi:MAG: hypothetical protein KF854_05510 [Nitrospira sp.]|nr:hypothetical protein [Nitrospira sp.]MBX7037692.1 hypothetical protein [Nitrospira sp.]MCW5795406.1 hypothetical protein [Nitrospira sp.]HMV56043.1 hypothetical protein [Nitrospira sp.]HNA84841.1 hypothetical protein [Nitrospira sp.]